MKPKKPKEESGSSAAAHRATEERKHVDAEESTEEKVMLEALEKESGVDLVKEASDAGYDAWTGKTPAVTGPFNPPTEVQIETTMPSFSIAVTGVHPAPCVVCGTAVAPGAVCVVDGHRAE